MKSEIVSVCGNTKYHCVRLHRGEDLLKSIEELCKEKEINAKSVLNVMASGVKCGAEIELQCTGEDEAEALEAICELIATGLEEY